MAELCADAFGSRLLIREERRHVVAEPPAERHRETAQQETVQARHGQCLDEAQRLVFASATKASSRASSAAATLRPRVVRR